MLRTFSPGVRMSSRTSICSVTPLPDTYPLLFAFSAVVPLLLFSLKSDEAPPSVSVDSDSYKKKHTNTINPLALPESSVILKTYLVVFSTIFFGLLAILAFRFRLSVDNRFLDSIVLETIIWRGRHLGIRRWRRRKTWALGVRRPTCINARRSFRQSLGTARHLSWRFPPVRCRRIAIRLLLLVLSRRWRGCDVRKRGGNWFNWGFWNGGLCLFLCRWLWVILRRTEWRLFCLEEKITLNVCCVAKLWQKCKILSKSFCSRNTEIVLIIILLTDSEAKQQTKSYTAIGKYAYLRLFMLWMDFPQKGCWTFTGQQWAFRTVNCFIKFILALQDFKNKTLKFAMFS